MPLIKRHTKRQILITTCVDVAHILSGCLISWSAPIIPKLQDPTQTPLDGAISVKQASWLASVYMLSSLTGPHIAGPISNKIGRRSSIIVAELITLLAVILLTAAHSYEVILAGRMIAGLGQGMIIITDFVYIGEIASPSIRGMLLSSTGIFHSLGVLFMYCIGPFVSYMMVGIIFICLSLLHLCCCLFLPESQMFYVIQGKTDEARSTLQGVRKSTEVDFELQNMIETVQNNNEKASYKEIFTVKNNRKAFIIVLMLSLLQECCGVMAIIHYSTTIFQLSKSSIDPDVATIVVGVAQFIMALLVPAFVDKFGRKTMLLISSASCVTCTTLLGVYFYLIEFDNEVMSIGWLPLLLVVLFYCCYGAGISIIPNTIAGEMFNPRTRARGSALSMTIGWAAGFVLISSFGYIVEALGGYVLFFTFAFINCLGFVFVYFVVPETKGLSLAEIQKILQK